MTASESEPTPHSPNVSSGASMHAGNDYHYLYAASRALELLDRDAGVLWISLEGLEELDDDAKLDVSVAHLNHIELIQVKWTASPDSPERRIKPSEFWEIVAGLWAGSAQLSSERKLLLRTNRMASPDLLPQLEVLRRWDDMTRQDISRELLRVAGEGDTHANATLVRLLQIVAPEAMSENEKEKPELRKVLENSDRLAEVAALAQSLAFYTHRAGEDERADLRRTVENQLRLWGRDPVGWLDTLLAYIVIGRQTGRHEAFPYSRSNSVGW